MGRQFVVELRNDPGSMATLAETLAARGVDLRAIGGGGIGGSGHVIMTTADDDTTRAVLDEGGYHYVEGESLIAEVDDRPGGMARVARALADAGVNIHGHLFIGRWGDRATFAFVVDRPDLARPILERQSD
ncbi:MAG TPA: ACT domain-containing protein [Candidatus Limnocylindrales bacterium]|nr:ACT domain-containing protein [Candidatus Limnocylindrales bacterium]